jgi:hypothetical protein
MCGTRVRGGDEVEERNEKVEGYPVEMKSNSWCAFSGVTARNDEPMS